MSAISPNTTLPYSSSDSTTPDGSEPAFWGLPKTAWVKIGLVAALFIAIFWPNLRRIWGKTNPFSSTGDANWQHAVAVPLIGLYYLYINRDPLRAARAKTAWPGLGVLVGGLIISMYGIYPGRNDFIWDFGMVVALFGVVLLLAGWQVMKTAWFPILFLVCALPWPGLFYSWLAGPLQELAARVAVKTLQLTGVQAAQNGTKIFMFGGDGSVRPLNVAEACSGLKSLMTFITVAGAIAFLSARPLWQKILITLSAVPIAVFCNVMRVAGQGLIDYYWSRELSEGFAHQFVGMIMLIPAFFMILLVAWILDHLFIEEADEKARLRARAQAAQAAGARARPQEKVIQIPRQGLAGAGAGTASAVAPPSAAPTLPPAARERVMTVPPRPTGLAGVRPTPARKPPASNAAPPPPAAQPQSPRPVQPRTVQQPQAQPQSPHAGRAVPPPGAARPQEQRPSANLSSPSLGPSSGSASRGASEPRRE